MVITPDPPSSANWDITLNRTNVLKLSDAAAVNDLEYGTDGTLYTWANQSAVNIPGRVGAQVTVTIGSGLREELADIESRVRFQSYENRTALGLNINRVPITTLDLFSPTHDLDSHSAGIFLFECYHGIASGSNLSWQTNVPSSGVVFSNSIVASSPYDSTSRVEGVLLGAWTLLYNDAVHGEMRVYMAKDGEDSAGVYATYEPGSSAASTTGSVQAIVSVAFQSLA